mgnify:CR=1 FL=1
MANSVTVEVQGLPEVLAKLRANPAMLKTAVDEFVRWGSPSVHVGRTASRDVEFDGHTLKLYPEGH